MPNARNLTELSFVIDTIHDSIWSKNDLTNIVIRVFRDDTTGLGEFLKVLCLRNKLVSERHRTVMVITCDKTIMS